MNEALFAYLPAGKLLRSLEALTKVVIFLNETYLVASDNAKWSLSRKIESTRQLEQLLFVLRDLVVVIQSLPSQGSYTGDTQVICALSCDTSRSDGTH